jgi:D-3-phosphoglycerate dehydrogenase / 2-oxoglutarate reductase
LLYVPKVVITDYGFPSVEIERQIVEVAGGELAAFHCKDENDVIAAARDADAVIVQWAPITREVIQNLRNCKVIVRYGIGIDNIDLDAARSRGIAVCNVPNYCIDEVADHTLALALSLARQLPAIDRQVRQGVWKIVPPRPMPASRQMNFVTIGCGRIARAVLMRAKECKFSLATYDPYLPTGDELSDGIRRLDMDEALETADILSLHVPLSADTHHLINTTTLSKMKPTSILVNTARGGLVDTVALAAALENGQIAAAGIDVFEHEPLGDDHPLKKCANALLSSHVSWYSELSVPELQRLAAEEAARGIRGGPLENRVA